MQARALAAMIVPLDPSYAANSAAWNSRCQTRQKNFPHVIIAYFRVGISTKISRHLKLGVTVGAAPKMADVPLAHALGQFGGDQTVSALVAGHPVDGTSRRCIRCHVDLPCVLLGVSCLRVQKI